MVQDKRVGIICEWTEAWLRKNHQTNDIIRVLYVGQNVSEVKEALQGAKVSGLPEKLASLQGNEFLTALAEQAGGHANHFTAIIVDNAVASFNLNTSQAFSSLIKSLLLSLKTGGALLFRENLVNGSKNIAQYTDYLDTFRSKETENSGLTGLRFLWAKLIPASIQEDANFFDTCWLLEKEEFPETPGETVSMRDFLDQKQYSDSGIGLYERIFGYGFISPGGSEENAKFVEQMKLKPGEKILDVGCGIGGNAFYCAEKYDVHVTGLDLSSNMLSVAISRAQERKDKRLDFLIADATQFDFPENHFDAIYSRDCIIHIPDKQALFERFYRWLKPGGRVVMTDYCVGDQEHSAKFNDYLNRRQYGLRTIATYQKAFENAKFRNVTSQDLTPRFQEILEAEFKDAEANKEEYIKAYSAEKYASLVEGWNNKLGYISDGDHKWAAFKAEK